jgi:uncharacterized protein (TIGR03067 family)
MRFAFGILLSVAVLALALGCGKKDNTASGGGASLEGTWILNGMEILGEKAPAEEINKEPESDRTLKVTADKMIFTKRGKEDPSTYTIDKSKTPAHIDLVGKKEGGKEEKAHGIYKIEGDTLTLCIAESDNPDDRPKEFKTEKDAKRLSMVMILTRKK